MKTNLKNLIKNIPSQSLWSGFLFSLSLVLFGIIPNANAINVVAIENLPTENLANHNQNSIGGWAGQSFKATQDNISGVSVYAGYGGYAETPNPRSDTRMTVILRDSSGNNIDYTQSQEYVAVSQGAEMYVAFDEPLSLTVDTNYQFVIVWEDVRMTYHEESSPGSYANGQNLDGLGDLKFKIWYEDGSTGSDDYGLYYGNSPVYTVLGNNYDLPVVYNVCDTYSSTSTNYVVLQDENGIDLADPIVLTSCSGTIVYNSLSEGESSDSAHFLFYNGLDLDVSSNVFLNNVYTSLDLPADYIHYYYPDNFNINTSNASGTAILNFAYSVCNDPNWANTNITLINNDLTFNTGLHHDIISCTGIGTIEMPFNQVYQLSFPAYLRYIGGSYDLRSTDFIISFYSNFTSIASSTAFQNNLANNTSTPDYEQSQTFMAVAGDFLKSVLYPIFWTVKQWFPFNIPVIIYDSWVDSADSNLPSDLTVFSPLDSSGNLTVSLPQRFMGSATTSVVVFGGDLLTADASAGAWYSGVRVFSTYLLWFMFVSLVIFVAYKVFAMISGRDDTAFNTMPTIFQKKDGYSTRIHQTVYSKRSRGRKTYSKNV